MTNIQDIFTLLLETEDKYPPKCKIRCRNAQTWSSWMNTTLSSKEKKGQNPILSSDQFCSFYTAMRITNAVLDTVMYFQHVICLNFTCIAVYHMYTWYQEEVLNLLKYELQMTVSCQVGAGNQTSVLCKNITYF